MRSCWYTPARTWVDGLIAVIVADREVRDRCDSWIDACENAESEVWRQLRNKIDFDTVLRWTPAWHEYGYYSEADDGPTT